MCVKGLIGRIYLNYYIPKSTPLFGLNEAGFVGAGVEELDTGFPSKDGLKVTLLNSCLDEMPELSGEDFPKTGVSGLWMNTLGDVFIKMGVCGLGIFSNGSFVSTSSLGNS